MMAYQETFVQRAQHRIYVRECPGAEPAIILMHGFPDNVHLYDRLSPYLSPPRRVARPVSRMFGNWLFRRMYGCTGGRSGGSSETRMSDVSSCRCCINS